MSDNRWRPTHHEPETKPITKPAQPRREHRTSQRWQAGAWMVGRLWPNIHGRRSQPMDALDTREPEDVTVTLKIDRANVPKPLNAAPEPKGKKQTSPEVIDITPVFAMVR
jgi:hypothetical protein